MSEVLLGGIKFKLQTRGHKFAAKHCQVLCPKKTILKTIGKKRHAVSERDWNRQQLNQSSKVEVGGWNMPD